MAIFIEENFRKPDTGYLKSMNKSFEGVSARHRFSRPNIEMRTIYKSLNRSIKEGGMTPV
jgi:hypothetical protein